MTSWGYRALKAAALCSLVFLFITAEAVKGDQNVDLAASSVADGSSGSRKLSSQTDSKLHISSLHDSAQPDMINETSISSASYTLRGIKPGLPATCYGQPCSASACYPAALVTVSTHVNYVNVTATVEFSRRYKITSCSNVTSDSCEIYADGAGIVADITQLTDTTVSVLVQMREEGLAMLYWTPSDCSGSAMQILLSPVTYDITPPVLAILQTTGKGNVTLAQTASAAQTVWQNSGRRLQYFTLSPASSSSKTYGANVVFSFSEEVQDFGGNYAFIKGGQLSSTGLNETVSQKQYSATIVADNTKSALVMVTGSTYQDLAGNVGTSDLNATVRVSVLSTDSTLSSSTTTTSTAPLSRRGMAGVIIGVILGAFFLVLLCFLCMWRRSKAREARQEQAALAAAAAAAEAPVTAVAAGRGGPVEVKEALKQELKGKGKGADLDVKPSAPTSVPLRVRFGTGTPTGGAAHNPMFAQDGSAPRTGPATELSPMRSELPISTLTDAIMDSDDEASSPRGGQGYAAPPGAYREGSVDDRSDSAMLDSRPSGPLIQDPSGVYPYGSGSYEGPIASFPSDAAGQAEAIHNAAATPRSRPHSRFAAASDGSALPHTATAGSRAWGDVDLSAD